MQRRHFLQCASALSCSGFGLSALLPSAAIAAWPKSAFNSEDLPEAERLLFGDVAFESTDLITIGAPEIAENGRVVPIQLRVDLPNPRSVALFSPGNPFPLLVRAEFTEQVEPEVSVRVRLGESTDLVAIAQAGEQFFRATRWVKVTAGGCGG